MSAALKRHRQDAIDHRLDLGGFEEESCGLPMVAKTAMFVVVQEQEGSCKPAAINGKAEPTGYFRPRSYSSESTYVCYDGFGA